jgi:hypothetical protein
MTGTRPLKTIAAGSCRAAIWENEILVNGGTKTVLKASVERRHEDKDGTWKSSQTFSRNEIPLAVYCLEKAFEAIIGAEREDSNGNSVAEEVVSE